MHKVWKGLAIGALIVTIIGASGLLVAINTLEPVVEKVTVTVVPATEQEAAWTQVTTQTEQDTFCGTLYESAMGLEAESCTFLTYTVRLKNRGFFPVEWIALRPMPIEGDVLQMDNPAANVLPNGAEGDISATLLHRGEAKETARALVLTCHVLGRVLEMNVWAE